MKLRFMLAAFAAASFNVAQAYDCNNIPRSRPENLCSCYGGRHPDLDINPSTSNLQGFIENPQLANLYTLSGQALTEWNSTKARLKADIATSIKQSFSGHSKVDVCIETSQNLRDTIVEINHSLGHLGSQANSTDSAISTSVVGYNLNPAATDTNSTPLLDPTREFTGAAFLKMADGSLAPGESNADKHRKFMAEKFERMVRIFVGGSDQLNRDFPFSDSSKRYSGPSIKGVYEGYMPDLLNSTPDHLIQGRFDVRWGGRSSESDGPCSKGDAHGVANEHNGDNKFFKSTDGTFHNEASGGSWSNHICTGSVGQDDQYKDVPGKRGQIINAMMILMRNMKVAIEQGKLLQPTSFGPVEPTSCIQLREDILAMRRVVSDEFADVQKGISAGQPNAKALDCAQSNVDSGQVIESGGIKSLAGNQPRICVIESMRNHVELEMTLRYSYCTWRTVAGAILTRMNHIFVTQRQSGEVNSCALDPWREDPVHRAGTSVAGLFFGISALISRPKRKQLRNPKLNPAHASFRLGCFCAAVAIIVSSCSGIRTHDTQCGDSGKEWSGLCDNNCKPLKDSIYGEKGYKPTAQTVLADLEGKNKDGQYTAEIQKTETRMGQYDDVYNKAFKACKDQHFNSYAKKKMFSGESYMSSESMAAAKEACICDSGDTGSNEPSAGSPTLTFKSDLLASQAFVSKNADNTRTTLAPILANQEAHVANVNPATLADAASALGSAVTGTAGAGSGSSSSQSGKNGSGSGAGDGSSNANSNRRPAGTSSGNSSGSSGSGNALGTSGNGSGNGSSGDGSAPNGALGAGNDALSTYQQGGGGAGGHGGAGASNGAGGDGNGLGGMMAGLLGAKNGSEGSGLGGEISFDAKDGKNGSDDALNGAQFKTLGKDDPEDYFDRTKSFESIFKIVTKRYHDKAYNWVMNDAHHSSQAMKK